MLSVNPGETIAPIPARRLGLARQCKDHAYDEDNWGNKREDSAGMAGEGDSGREITALVGDTLLDFLDMFIRSILFKTNLPSLTALSTML